MSVNQFPQKNGTAGSKVEKKPTSFLHTAAQVLTLIGLIVAVAVAPAIVIAAWRFFL